MKKGIIFAIFFAATGCQKWNSIIVGFQRIVGHDNKPLTAATFCDTINFPYHRDTVYLTYNNMPTDMPRGANTENADGTRDYYFFNKVVSVNGQYGVKTNIPEPNFRFFQTN